MTEEQFIVRGPELAFDPPTEALGTVLLKRMETFGDRTAYINAVDGSSETFTSFRSKSICIAENMRLHGIGKGDNISICSRNQVNAFATVIAGVLIGAPVNGFDSISARYNVKHMLNLVKPKVLFCETEDLSFIKEVLSEIGFKTLIVVYGDDENEHVPFRKFLVENGTNATFKPMEFTDLKKATALIVYTSGSTERPKPVMLSHFSLVSQYKDSIHKQQISISTTNCNRDDNRVFTWSTLYWLTGMTTLFGCLYSGFTRIFPTETFSEKSTLRIIASFKPTILLLPSVAFNRLVKYPDVEKYDLSSINVIRVAGCRISPELTTKMSQLLPSCEIITAYGMSECSTTIASRTKGVKNFNAVGKLLKGFSAKVIDMVTGETVGRNVAGEICVKSDLIMQGYYMNPEETARVIDKDGWLHTGDMGYFDNEESLYVIDRVSEILKCQNICISPADVENELLKHPSVASCCIVGIPHEVFGDLLAAFVVLVETAQATEEELKSHVAGLVCDASKLRCGVIFLPELPVLPSGKLNRKQLKIMALDMKEELMAKADLNTSLFQN